MMINRARSHFLSALAASLVLLAAGGCRDKDKDKDRERSEVTGPLQSAPRQTEPAPAQQEAQDPDLTVLTITAIDIDTKLAAMCGIPGSQVYFKYDSANLSAEAKERLDRIVTCTTTGAAKGKELLVVGRTDPVGSDAYNQQLGKSRAAAVSEYLRTQGVQKQRVEIESKGERAASPFPWRWPEERRVTVRLQE